VQKFLQRPVDNSVDEFFMKAVTISATDQKQHWSFFVHKIKRTQNRQLQRVENASTKWRLCDACY
jgi:hypothetical protein